MWKQYELDDSKGLMGPGDRSQGICLATTAQICCQMAYGNLWTGLHVCVGIITANVRLQPSSINICRR